MVKSDGGPKRLTWGSLGLERPYPPGLWPVGTPMPPLRRLIKEMAQERHWRLVESISESMGEEGAE